MTINISESGNKLFGTGSDKYGQYIIQGDISP